MTDPQHDAFAIRLREAATHVEERLAACLARAEAAGTPPRLAAAMRHAVLGGGKRFRPFLVLEAARMLGGAPAAEAALDAASALECVHAYSLAHDDLPAMDNDALRRGQPTVWKAFDEWTAILAGDGLLTLAFEIIAGGPGGDGALLPPAARVELIRRLASAAGPAGMVGGQALDLASEKLLPRSAPDAGSVQRLQAMKTGALIRFACEAGAIAAGASSTALGDVSRYGEALGLAFQISDDLLDATGDAETVGKAVGKDLALGKATLVAVEGVEAARCHLVAAVARAEAAIAAYGPAAEPLRAAARFLASRRH